MEPNQSLGSFPEPPGSSLPMRRIARRIAAPVERFLHTEQSGGVLLLFAAIAALAWANSPWGHTYHELWHSQLSVGVGNHVISGSLEFWINELLMTIFFMVAGLEIKREMAEGELSDLRRASLPIVAAIGGMLVPAAIYFAFNSAPGTRSGWGVPMATDIAFAVGILSLLGKRVPAALRILLLAVAIIDDIGAILVIAIFYTANFAPEGLLIAGAGLAGLIFIQRIGMRPGAVYFLPGLVIWYGLHHAGVHPTIAGVIIGLSTPVQPWLSNSQFIGLSERALDEFRSRTAGRAPGHETSSLEPLRRLSVAGREAISPITRLESAYHPWVAFVIMPLFALANAGVDLRGLDFDLAGGTTVALGVGFGLWIGKPAGILLATWVATKLGLCRLPRGTTWAGLLVLGSVAGIGFTMSIFIADLAFPGSALLPLAKLAILGGTAAAAITGLLAGRLLLPPQSADPVAASLSPEQAEQSTAY